jgi:hypothetical protein
MVVVTLQLFAYGTQRLYPRQRCLHNSRQDFGTPRRRGNCRSVAMATAEQQRKKSPIVVVLLVSFSVTFCSFSNPNPTPTTKRLVRKTQPRKPRVPKKIPLRAHFIRVGIPKIPSGAVSNIKK